MEMINYTKEFSDKVAIITGAGSGIGKETAKRMIDNGAKVALWDYNEDTLN
ncbi:MAG: SDR family NAD(P)-dependent oxidoreductase, partial [Alphaproteobacteria bacterium]